MKALFFPFLTFVTKDPKKMLLLLVLQITIIGWLPAAVIAYDEENVERKRKELLQKR